MGKLKVYGQYISVGFAVFAIVFMATQLDERMNPELRQQSLQSITLLSELAPTSFVPTDSAVVRN